MPFIKRFVCVVTFIMAMDCSAQSAVDFSFTDLNGVGHNLFQELDKGNTIVLDFFFVDCKPCQKLTPGMVNMYNEYVSQSKKIIVFGISDRDGNSKLSVFEDDFNVSYSSCGVDGGGDSITDLYKARFNFQGWPTYAVICPNREVYWNLERDSSFLELRDAIDSCAQRVDMDVKREELSFEIYPNPAHDVISINVPNAPYFEVNIFSLEGKELLTKKSKTSELKMDIKALNPGIYPVQIKEGVNIYMSKIIVK